MKTEIRITGDGSKTLFVPELNEHYHSTFGAVAESKHVFIEAGLKYVMPKFNEIHLLEIGFGTGLNALLTLQEIADKIIHYTAIEPFPLDDETIVQLIDDGDKESSAKIFRELHKTSWNEKHQITSNFFLTKIKSGIEEFALLKNHFNLVYFDAFGPDVQPDLWTYEVFSKISGSMVHGGILTTYSAKGEIRRNLKKAGFDVERIPGPPGKRHMTRGERM